MVTGPPHSPPTKTPGLGLRPPEKPGRLLSRSLAWGFPPGPAVKNPPGSTRDTDWIPDPGRAPTPRDKCGVPLQGERDAGELCGAHQGCRVPFQPPIPNVGLLLRRCSGKGLHLAMTGEPRGFSRVAAGYSSYDGEFRMPLVLAQGSPIFHSSCEGKLGIALE